MILWSPTVDPYSVRACELDMSSRNYDCQHCEHFHVDCELGDQIQWDLENEHYEYLPKSLQNKIYYEKAMAAYEDAMAIIKKWESEKNGNE